VWKWISSFTGSYMFTSVTYKVYVHTFTHTHTHTHTYIYIYIYIYIYTHTIPNVISWDDNYCNTFQWLNALLHFEDNLVGRWTVHCWLVSQNVSRNTNDIPRILCFRALSIICCLTLTLLTWRIWWSPNNARSWQMGFNSAFTGLKTTRHFQKISLHLPSFERLSESPICC